MRPAQKFGLIIAHLGVSIYMWYSYFIESGGPSPFFAGLWAMMGSILLVVFAADVSDRFGTITGLGMLGMSFYLMFSADTDLWFILSVIGTLLTGYELYATGKRSGPMSDYIVIYLSSISITLVSVIEWVAAGY